MIVYRGSGIEWCRWASREAAKTECLNRGICGRDLTTDLSSQAVSVPLCLLATRGKNIFSTFAAQPTGQRRRDSKTKIQISRMTCYADQPYFGPRAVRSPFAGHYLRASW